MNMKEKEIFCVVFETKNKDYEIEFEVANNLNTAMEKAASDLMGRIGINIACVDACAVVSLSEEDVNKMMLEMKK